jgi:hypothetical protein
MISFRSLIAVAVLALAVSAFAGDSKYDADLTKKIEKIIREVQQIKPGMTRADLLKVFTTEGGISNRKWRRYVHPTCPYIKVDVEFEPVGEEKDMLTEKAADRITKISEWPFLEFSISD